MYVSENKQDDHFWDSTSFSRHPHFWGTMGHMKKLGIKSLEWGDSRYVSTRWYIPNLTKIFDGKSKHSFTSLLENLIVRAFPLTKLTALNSTVSERAVKAELHGKRPPCFPTWWVVSCNDISFKHSHLTFNFVKRMWCIPRKTNKVIFLGFDPLLRGIFLFPIL